jgi:hypothetical protein
MRPPGSRATSASTRPSPRRWPTCRRWTPATPPTSWFECRSWRSVACSAASPASTICSSASAAPTTNDPQDPTELPSGPPAQLALPDPTHTGWARWSGGQRGPAHLDDREVPLRSGAGAGRGQAERRRRAGSRGGQRVSDGAGSVHAQRRVRPVRRGVPADFDDSALSELRVVRHPQILVDIGQNHCVTCGFAVNEPATGPGDYRPEVAVDAGRGRRQGPQPGGRRAAH